MNQKTLHIGLQEVFGKSLVYYGIGFGVKIDARLESIYTWKY